METEMCKQGLRVVTDLTRAVNVGKDILVSAAKALTSVILVGNQDTILPIALKTRTDNDPRPDNLNRIRPAQICIT